MLDGAVAKESRMNDLAQIDLSGRADGELSPEERAELQRRFKSFTQAVKESALMRPAAPEKPKKISKWNPLARAKSA
jgi:anti-sigma factor RsiW